MEFRIRKSALRVAKDSRPQAVQIAGGGTVRVEKDSGGIVYVVETPEPEGIGKRQILLMPAGLVALNEGESLKCRTPFGVLTIVPPETSAPEPAHGSDEWLAANEQLRERAMDLIRQLSPEGFLRQKYAEHSAGRQQMKAFLRDWIEAAWPHFSGEVVSAMGVRIYDAILAEVKTANAWHVEAAVIKPETKGIEEIMAATFEKTQPAATGTPWRLPTLAECQGDPEATRVWNAVHKPALEWHAMTDGAPPIIGNGDSRRLSELRVIWCYWAGRKEVSAMRVCDVHHALMDPERHVPPTHWMESEAPTPPKEFPKPEITAHVDSGLV